MPAPNAGADKQQAYNDIVALREQALRQATEADGKRPPSCTAWRA